MSLVQIREELCAINEALTYGEVEFMYDVMGVTMSFTHPSEVLDDYISGIDVMMEYGEDRDELRNMLDGMKEARHSFELVELEKPIELLESYLKD